MLARVDALVKANVDVIVIDSAHGHSENILKADVYKRQPLAWESLFCLFHKIKINNEIKKTRENKSIKEIKPE